MKNLAGFYYDLMMIHDSGLLFMGHPVQCTSFVEHFHCDGRVEQLLKLSEPSVGSRSNKIVA